MRSSSHRSARTRLSALVFRRQDDCLPLQCGRPHIRSCIIVPADGGRARRITSDPFHQRLSQLLARRQVDLLQFDAEPETPSSGRFPWRAAMRCTFPRPPGSWRSSRRTAHIFITWRAEQRTRWGLCGACRSMAVRPQAGGRRDVHQLRGRRARGVLPGTRLRRNEAPILRFRHTPVNPCRRKYRLR